MTLEFRTAGHGPPMLLLHGAAEDVGLLTAQAEAFAARGRRVIWADRRTPADGSLARGVAGHCDDAADLLRHQGAAPATVVGFSSGGVLALALAARHPDVVAEAIAWEPPALSVLPDGAELHAGLIAPIRAHLAAHPGDWPGAYDVMLDVLSEGRADHDAPVVRAMRRNAQAALRDDAEIITRHRFAPGELTGGTVRIAVGARPDPLHGAVAERLAALTGTAPLVVADADDHEVYLHRPEVLAEALG